ncbi:hypothetical protein KBI33_00165 [Candidatus Shapirobacteria bacterium]|nr:hypothetical protein [Candidatus Shapirobacteria bacterium]
MAKQEEISFLKEGETADLQEKEKFQKALRTSAGVLLLWVLILGGILGYSLILGRKNGDLKKEKADLVSELETQKENLGQILIFKDRVGKIDPLLKKRPDLAAPVEKVVASLPAEINLKSLEVGAGKIQLSGEGEILPISSFLDHYTNKKGEWFKKATLNSLAKDEKNPTFNFSLTIEF